MNGDVLSGTLRDLIDKDDSFMGKTLLKNKALGELEKKFFVKEALKSCAPKMIEMLYKMGEVKADDTVGETHLPLLCWAASKGKADICKSLLDNGEDPNTRCEDTMSALHHACRLGRVECVKILVENGADVNIIKTKGKGLTPLHYAALHDELETVVLLLRLGADVNARSHDGQTAVEMGLVEAIDERVVEVMKAWEEKEVFEEESSRGVKKAKGRI